MASDDNPVLGNCYFVINADKTEIIEGDNVQFTINLYGGCSGNSLIDIYINNIVVNNEYLSDGSLVYTHTFNESGGFTVYVAASDNSSLPSNYINITVKEAIIESLTPQVSWKINNKNVQSIEINNKEVQSIVENDTGDILFQKSNNIEDLPVMTLTVTESTFSTHSSTPFIYNGRVFVDWGDDSELMEYTGGELSHNFTDGISKHIIQVYGNITSLGSNCFLYDSGLTSIELPSGVTSLGNACFGYCNGLTSVILPDTITNLQSQCFIGCTGLIEIDIPEGVTSLGGSCFMNCSGLTSIRLNWDSSTNILTYQSSWISYANSILKFIIPYGTTQLYADKGYPSNKLEEEIPFDNIVLSADKSVLSSYHNDSCTLTAQLMHDSTPINLAGVTVTFSGEEGGELYSTETNTSGVATMNYRTKKGLTNTTNEYIIATAEGFDSDTCEIEICFYASNQQYDIIRNGTTVITKLNNDIITNLPSSYSIEFDMKSSNNPTSNAEQRIYWAPNDLWTGTGQPSLAAFVGYCYPSKLEAGRRLNAQTSKENSKTVTPSEWSHITIRKDETQIYWFSDNKDKTGYYSSWDISGGDNYTDWIFGIILWSDTTFSIKNLKIKSTEVHVIKPDDEVEGATIETP